MAHSCYTCYNRANCGGRYRKLRGGKSHCDNWADPNGIKPVLFDLKIQKCAYCGEGILKKVGAIEPYSPEHFMCDKCDSTYTLEEIEKDG